MLNVPTEVQALFKADSVFKNFRVHFPNGENADLTNDDIVSESVSFTESICSAQVFQFGLSERSEIEFECVGVQNIYGMTIECAIEICVDSLGATWISDHAPTGNEAFLDLQVCTYNGRNMYRIPYGRFIVESCPRSQGAMKHRRVTAYSVDGYANASNITSPILNCKLNTLVVPTMVSESGQLPQNAFLLIAGETQNVAGLTLTESTLTLRTGQDRKAPRYEWESGGVTHVFEIQGDSCSAQYAFTNGANSLYRATWSFNSAALTSIEEAIAEAVSLGADETEIRTMTEKWYTPFYSCDKVTDETPFESLFNVGSRVNIPQDTGYFYGNFYEDGNTSNASSAVFFPVDIHIAIFTGSQVFYDETIQPVVSNPVVKQYQQTDASINKIVVGIAPTARDGGYSSYLGGLNVYDLARGVSEVTGQFFTAGRDGTPEVVAVSNNNPVAMSPAEYSELWWDEYEVEPVGTIRCKYYDFMNQTTQDAEFSIGTGSSVYDMQDNYFLNNIFISYDELGELTVEEYILQFLQTYFVPNLNEISFVPVTLDAIGLPYIEAGDYLEIDDADDGTVGTYVLSRTLSGIQVLTDSIESKGGEVLGNGS